MRVWVELRLRSDADVNVTGDCVWAGGTLALDRLRFFCLNTAEETGLLGHRVRLGVDQTIVLAEVQVHEYSGAYLRPHSQKGVKGRDQWLSDYSL